MPARPRESRRIGLPALSHASTPTLGDYLPTRNRIPRSERYILGPVGLQANAPEIPAAPAAFQYGTEAEVAQYRFGQSTATRLSSHTRARSRANKPLNFNRLQAPTSSGRVPFS